MEILTALSVAMGWVQFLPDWIVAILMINGVATGVRIFVEGKSENTRINTIIKVIDILAGNVGKNKTKG